jgi:hypothetical protein
MKTCFKCNKKLSLGMFYKHPQMPDGHVNKYKECNKKDVTNNRNKNIDRVREYDRNRGNRQTKDGCVSHATLDITQRMGKEKIMGNL